MKNFIDQNLHSELHSEMNQKLWNAVDNVFTLNQAVSVKPYFILKFHFWAAG